MEPIDSHTHTPEKALMPDRFVTILKEKDEKLLQEEIARLQKENEELVKKIRLYCNGSHRWKKIHFFEETGSIDV